MASKVKNVVNKVKDSVEDFKETIDEVQYSAEERQKIKCLEYAVQVKPNNGTGEEVLDIAKMFYEWVNK